MEDFGSKFNATIIELLLMISVYSLHTLLSAIKMATSFFTTVVFIVLLLTLPIWAIPAYIHQRLYDENK